MRKITETKNKNQRALSVILTVLLAFFLCLIFYVNLSCNPEYYDGDMYSDLNYAKEAWKAKSLFPSSWIFGNQTYAFSTPVLAALLYGMTSNVILSMAAASCIMTVLIVLSYDWMMKPLYSYNERIGSFLIMAGFVIGRKHIAASPKGAQLLFTMASYYAGYLIIAFVIYGCYIRIRNGYPKKKTIPMALLSVALSFASGTQSLRQTAVTVLPLVACEGLLTLAQLIKSKRIKNPKTLIFSVAILISNIAGLITVKLIKPNQHQIFGETSLNLSFENICQKAVEVIKAISRLFRVERMPSPLQTVFTAFFVILIFTAIIMCVVRLAKYNEKEHSDFSLLFMFFLGVAGIFIVGLITNIQVREIYYFMLFPLIAVSSAYILKIRAKLRKPVYACLAVVFSFVIAYNFAVTSKEIKAGRSTESSAHVAARYALDNGYEHIYASFSCASNIAIASGDKLDLVFLENNSGTLSLEPVNYLCVKDYYKLCDNSETLYYFTKDDREKANELAEKLGVKPEIAAEFGDGSCFMRMPQNVCILAQRESEKNSVSNQD